MCLFRCEVDNIGASFGRSSHRGVHETEERSQRLDDEHRHEDQHARGICSQRTGVAQVAWVDSDGRDVAKLWVLAEV